MPDPQPEAPPSLVVSIVIVSYNNAPALRRCLTALETSPDRPQTEIIVVDNGSRDGSQTIDSEFPGVTVLRLPHHCGLTKPRNIGIRTAKGEFILLLSPTVALEPGVPAALAARLEENDKALAVIPMIVDESGNTVTIVRQLPSIAQTKSCWRDPAGLPALDFNSDWDLHDGLAILLRKRSIQGINFLDEKYGEYWIDVELAYQIRRAGKRIALEQDLRGVYQASARVLSRDAAIRSSFAADAANGAAVYLGKRFGFMTGLLFRLRMTLLALFQLVTFQDPGYAAAMLSRLTSSYKIDGTSNQFS